MRSISACDQALVFSTALHCLLHHAINLSLRPSTRLQHGTSLPPAPCDQSQPATRGASCWDFTASCTMLSISACDQALVFSTELHCLLHHAINLSLRQAVHLVGDVDLLGLARGLVCCAHTPPAVSKPIDKGVTSNSSKSCICEEPSPVRIALCTAVPYATSSSGFMDLERPELDVC